MLEVKHYEFYYYDDFVQTQIEIICIMENEMRKASSLMRYFESLEDRTMGNFENYRKKAKLLDDCRAKKFPNLERLGLIKQHTEEEE